MIHFSKQFRRFYIILLHRIIQYDLQKQGIKCLSSVQNVSSNSRLACTRILRRTCWEKSNSVVRLVGFHQVKNFVALFTCFPSTLLPSPQPTNKKHAHFVITNQALGEVASKHYRPGGGRPESKDERAWGVGRPGSGSRHLCRRRLRTPAGKELREGSKDKNMHYQSVTTLEVACAKHVGSLPTVGKA